MLYDPPPRILEIKACASLLTRRVSIEKSADYLVEVCLYVICCFSLGAFNILSLSLIFIIFLLCVLVHPSLGLSCLGLCVSWTELIIFFPMLVKFSAIISSNIFSGPFCLFSFWDPYNANVGAFTIISLYLGLSFYFSLYSVLL